MMRMTVTQEIDATPEMIKEALTNWSVRADAADFPYAQGEFCRLAPKLAEALGTHPEAPVLVIGRAHGCAIGTVAFISKTGTIQPMAVQPSQVRPLEDEPVVVEA